MLETFSRSTDSRVAPVAPERERTLGSTSLVEESRKVSSTVEPEERETLLDPSMEEPFKEAISSRSSPPRGWAGRVKRKVAL
ncbi:MAG: hypothetical protein BWY86_01262 [Candidatus Aminicenantes bacterium ADurb.Bin508]|nr:MAG: hypothetical protein BWY86_01262 [Candidatus Aminicenantes bacterium ADurb.Bin508]